MNEYRILRSDEIVQVGDEYFQADYSEWRITHSSVGHTVQEIVANTHSIYAFRRELEQEEPEDKIIQFIKEKCDFGCQDENVVELFERLLKRIED